MTTSPLKRATGVIIRTLRSTGHGSDYYGVCDRCGKHVSETFVSQSRAQYKRSTGEFYYSPIGGGAYGHRECLERDYGPHQEAVTHG